MTISSFYIFFSFVQFFPSKILSSTPCLKRISPESERAKNSHSPWWALKTERPLTSPAIYILIKRCLCKCGEPKAANSFMFTHMWPSLISPYNRIIGTWSRYDNRAKYFIFICLALSLKSIVHSSVPRKSFSRWICKFSPNELWNETWNVY